MKYSSVNHFQISSVHFNKSKNTSNNQRKIAYDLQGWKFHWRGQWVTTLTTTMVRSSNIDDIRVIRNRDFSQGYPVSRILVYQHSTRPIPLINNSFIHSFVSFHLNVIRVVQKYWKFVKCIPEWSNIHWGSPAAKRQLVSRSLVTGHNKTIPQSVQGWLVVNTMMMMIPRDLRLSRYLSLNARLRLIYF